MDLRDRPIPLVLPTGALKLQWRHATVYPILQYQLHINTSATMQ